MPVIGSTVPNTIWSVRIGLEFVASGTEEGVSVGDGVSTGESVSVGEGISTGEDVSIGEGTGVSFGEGVSVGEGVPAGKGEEGKEEYPHNNNHYFTGNSMPSTCIYIITYH